MSRGKTMAVWEESEKLREMASKIVSKKEEVAHVIIDEVLFLIEHETKPDAGARCYSLYQHPIGFFTDKRFCIVFYWQNVDYMSEQQLQILLFHEMKHIPATGNRLVKHDVQDFRSVLGIDLDWGMPGREVPDICG
jgi:hypothetical protein